MYYDGAYLQHYGVKGMKWGVRRYRNYDGSYTQKGLERYRKSEQTYHDSVSAYKRAKHDHKSGSVTKHEVREARDNTKQAKRALVTNYKQLKSDKLADQGRRLYSSGHTISGNDRMRKNASYASFGMYVATELLARSGHTRLATAANATSYGLTVGGPVVARYRNKRLRAYYGHSRTPAV